MSQGPDNRQVWPKLRAHARLLHRRHLRDLFDADPERGKRFCISATDLHIDLAKNLLNDKTLDLLTELAREAGLAEERQRMFAGEKINRSENRAVLHTALRNFANEELWLDGVEVLAQIRSERERMRVIVADFRSGRLLGFSGQPLRQVVHIGIGGSDLGPRMAVAALQHYAQREFSFHFVSNVDDTHLSEVLRHLDLGTTLFIVSSKTFTTQETMTNAATAKRWLLEKAGSPAAMAKHFLAVTANRPAALAFGIHPDNILAIWEWVGGRFSICSSVGLPLAMSIGFEGFLEMLQGCAAMDHHFHTAELARNAPVLLALLGIWYSHFWGAHSQAVVVYDQYLSHFPAYLQQLEMESNGKAVDRQGKSVFYPTAPVVWGGTGSDGQHAFFQLLHQGTRFVPIDFIGFARSLNQIGDHHRKLLANMLAQSSALAFGNTTAELAVAGVAQEMQPFRSFAGNRPSTTILAPELTPRVLGQLIALYEHKVFVQGVIWNIFSFDQWGVELGKKMAGRIEDCLAQEQGSGSELDSSTRALIAYCRKPRSGPDGHAHRKVD